MASALRPFTASLLALALLLGAFAPACKAQGEGERCDKAKTQNADCEPPLVCISSERLLENNSDRCCPEVSGEESDSRCTRKASTSGTGGGAGTSSSTGGTGGSAGSGASDSGGVPASDGGTGGAPDLGEAGATTSMAGQGGAP